MWCDRLTSGATVSNQRLQKFFFCFVLFFLLLFLCAELSRCIYISLHPFFRKGSQRSTIKIFLQTNSLYSTTYKSCFWVTTFLYFSTDLYFYTLNPQSIFYFYFTTLHTESTAVVPSSVFTHDGKLFCQKTFTQKTTLSKAVQGVFACNQIFFFCFLFAQKRRKREL